MSSLLLVSSADGDQRRQQHRDGDDVVEELRRRPPQVREQHPDGGGALEQVVRQIDEGRDVEQPGHRADRAEPRSSSGDVESGCRRRGRAASGRSHVRSGHRAATTDVGANWRSRAGDAADAAAASPAPAGGKPDRPALARREPAMPGRAEHQVGQPHRQPRSDVVALGQRLSDQQQAPVDEDHRQSRATKLANLPSLRWEAPSATPISANTRHAAGMENFLWISISGLCGEVARWHQRRRRAGPQFGDRHLALAARRPGAREHALGIERQHDLAEAHHLVAVGIAR